MIYVQKDNKLNFHHFSSGTLVRKYIYILIALAMCAK